MKTIFSLLIIGLLLGLSAAVLYDTHKEMEATINVLMGGGIASFVAGMVKAMLDYLG